MVKPKDSQDRGTIIGHCPNLQSLKFVDYNLTPAEFDYRIFGIQSIILPSLQQSLSASTTEGQQETLEPPHLETARIVFHGSGSYVLHLYRNAARKNHLRQAFEFPKLTKCSTGDIEVIDDVGISSGTTFERDNNNHTDTSDFHISTPQYSLKSLSIAPATGPLLESVITHAPYLTCLTIYKGSEQALTRAIPKLCPYLISLTLRLDGYRYDDHVWDLLFQGLPQLKEFNITDAILSTNTLMVLTQFCPKLESFNTDDDCKVSSPGISFMLKKCLALKKLSLDQSYGVDLFKPITIAAPTINTNSNNNGSGAIEKIAQ
ncbi:hypothetical protein BX616_000174 [Lobosporangium transversale]|uniref:Uncharacterized protein n=1 Tax=Lobosporangium transversale TaxID=64571 RepID=A0A1Y2GCZ4_9FUNG|nr:hypothetical protein BCR41DRAFT_399810 [Lobosporangium transversale]KAF9908373.1 hypothetical protein BX616_000174 [Lobosporangium transversale]ORZ07310.1 hypothetical protein BCR41DRAFT_399810 [Lobosporangium transversale]|eukprot:XP_021877973.1 hypothetical protein BCR41DRAFT_399810 [Lobosporangium transversale]